MSDGANPTAAHPTAETDADTAQAARPALRIVGGNPTPEDVAVIVAVLGSVNGGSSQSAPRGPRDLWGTAQDRLRPPMPLAPTAFVNLSVGY